MGFCLPAAIGAKFAKPNREVVAVIGDGGFQMTSCELATAEQEGIKVNVAIINNSFLGMVRQWQEFFYDKRYAATPMTGPDFVKLAEAYGCLGIRVEKEEEIDAAIKLAIATNDRPVVIDFIVSRDSMVWPMVAAGLSNDEVQYARDAAPIWDGVE